MDIDLIATRPQLNTAWKRVWTNGGAPGSDGLTCERFALNPTVRLDNLARRLVAGAHRAAPYRPVLVERFGRKPRLLLLPTIEDRIAQTAAARLLTPDAEACMHESSHAYRPGRWTGSAATELRCLRAAGAAEWVVETDIESCFESIRHRDALAALDRLGALTEPRLASLFHDRLARGAKAPGVGVAQGSAISPMICNLVLTRLDHGLTEAGFRFVRYADDLVVCAANAAGERCR